jgi:homospermidine synthase
MGAKLSTPHVTFPFGAKRKVVMIGAGCIARGLLPFLFVHLTGLDAHNVHIVTKDDAGSRATQAVVASLGIPDRNWVFSALTADNYRATLTPLLLPTDICINLSVDVSSVAVVELCAAQGALYVDTVTEPWAGAGGYYDTSLPAAARTNYALREQMVATRRRLGPASPTAVTVHGANPGLVSSFFKRALLHLADSTTTPPPPPTTQQEWAALAARVGVATVHIAEQDTQRGACSRRPCVFVNTWSVEGFLAEALQPAELGWGTAEGPDLPSGAAYPAPGAPCIYLDTPGAVTRVRSWTPATGPYIGFLVTHDEAISIADYYTVRDAAGAVTYRPTVHYAYCPCDGAILSLHELSGKGLQASYFTKHVILGPDDVPADGEDALGVLVAATGRNAVWAGSRLTNAQVVAATHAAGVTTVTNTATSMQVVAGVLAAVVWALENPARGVVTPDDLDAERVLAVAQPYLGNVGVWETAWTPAPGAASPWSFANVRTL